MLAPAIHQINKKEDSGVKAGLRAVNRVKGTRSGPARKRPRATSTSLAEPGGVDAGTSGVDSDSDDDVTVRQIREKSMKKK